MTAELSGETGSGRTLALLGGTGRTGRVLIDRALARGYALRVLARDPERLHRRGEALTPVQGDARNADDVLRLLEWRAPARS